MKAFVFTGVALLAGTLQAAGDAAKKPNFLWLVSEDNSIHYLRLYGNDLAPTPAIEALARDGLVFERAYSCGPVCSVARTTLATGIYAPRGGFQYHRKSRPARLPEGRSLWPRYLKDAGYHTSNNAKTDFNVEADLDAVFDENSSRASWRDRQNAATPFFHMRTFPASHEGSLHFSAETMATEKTETPPDQVRLAPYHPDTPTFRYTYARYHDRIRAMDRQIGEVVAQLEADGLLEDTFIFYFGDHGGVLPRSKGYAYDSGLHVPLVIRIPENFRHLVKAERASRLDGFVEFVDFGPTVLHLAGVDIPFGLDGHPFLGPEAEFGEEAFGYADRFDEKLDLVRSVHFGDYHYIRNYQAYYPDGLQNNYRYNMLAYAEWRRLWMEGKLNATQSRFFLRRPAEQLFDLRSDPHEVRDLAGDPDHAAALQEGRRRLGTIVREIHDLSFYPESHLVDQIVDDPVTYGREHAEEVARLADIADLALIPFERAEEPLWKAVTASSPWERYWGWITCGVIGRPANVFTDAALKALEDDHPVVRLRAAEFLGSLGAADPRPTLRRLLRETRSADEALQTLNAVVLFEDFEPRYPMEPTTLQVNAAEGQVERRLDYLGVRP